MIEIGMWMAAGWLIGVGCGAMWTWNWMRVAKRDLDKAGEHLNEAYKAYRMTQQLEKDAVGHLKEAHRVLEASKHL